MNQQNKKLVMFDFDGVLVNTIETSFEVHRSLNKNLTREIFDSWGDGNFYEEYQKALASGYKHPEDFGEKYQEQLYSLTIHEIINKSILYLSKKYILAIVSSTSDAYISRFLKKEGLFEVFSDISGAEVHKNKVVKIKNLLSKYELKPELAVYITDTLGDIREARECNVNSIGVTWGQHSSEHLQKGNPIAVIDDPRELVEAIENVLK